MHNITIKALNFQVKKYFVSGEKLSVSKKIIELLEHCGDVLLVILNYIVLGT